MEVQQPAQPQAQGAIPLGLRYNFGISDALPAERHLRRFQAENPSTFTPTNNVVRIPISSENFLDLRNAVLGFDLKNSTSSDTQFLDGGASCIIQRFRVLSASGRELERLEQFNLLSSVIDQYAGSVTSQISDDVLKGAPARCDMSPVMLAGDGTSASNTATAASGLIVSATTGGTMVVSNTVGGKGYDQKQACQLATGVTRHFEIPLRASGWFNPLAGKLLPPRSSFVVELTLCPAVQAFARLSGTDTQKYEATNFICSVPSVMVRDPGFQAAMEARLAQGVSWAANSFDHHVNTTPGAAGRDVLQIAARCKSLKGLITVMRKQSKIGAAGEFQNSRRSVQYVSQYQYQVGSQNYPSHQIDLSTDTNPGGTSPRNRLSIAGTADLNISEAYSEVQRVFGNLGVQSGATCLIGAEAYAQSEKNNGCGLIGVDLSSFSDGSVCSGINTKDSALPVSVEIMKTAAADGTVQLDSYAIKCVRYMRDASGDLMMDG